MACPVCNKATHAEFTPFCSNRCKNVDLNRWLTGAYAVPVVEMDDISDDQLGDESAAEES